MTCTDEKQLRELVQHLQNAWNTGDSVAWSEVFADDADFVHVLGGHYTGRESIERGHRVIFDTIYKGSTNNFTVEKVRFIAPDAALVFVFAELKIIQPGLPPLMRARPTLVTQKVRDRWQIIAFQNTIVTAEGAPGENDRLAQGITSALDSDSLAQHHPFKGQAKASGE